MRIALVHLRHSKSGGVERYLELLSAHLADAGHEPVVVCRSHAEPHHPGVEFVRLRPLSLGASARLWNFAVAVEQHVAAADYDLVYALGRTWTHDVIRLGGGCHATYLELAHEATCSAFERFVRKGERKQRVQLKLEHLACAPGNYARVITNSELIKRDAMARHAIPEELITVVHNGADTSRFTPELRDGPGRDLRRSLGWTGDEQVLLFLGTGYGRKGLDLVLEAAAQLAPERPGLRLLVVGFDSAQPRYEARAAELGLSGRCAFLGGRTDAEVCFAAADVYALPTRYDPFANSTIEALASGLPTITTRTNGGCEVIDEGVDGSVLSECPTADELAALVAHWLDHRAKGAEAARAKGLLHAAPKKIEATRLLLEELARERREDPASAAARGTLGRAARAWAQG
jgi:UDP-glucose:(heptosyl)LPS alpha-1,3-glucosyltransferase